jgi:hypothetical protein
LGKFPDKVDFFNPTPYLNPAAFKNVPTSPNGVPLRVGTAPRYIDGLRGPRFVSERFRMNKKFLFTEHAFIGLGVTANNPFNRTGRYIADNTVGNSQFGMVYASGAGQRTLQFDVRVEF